jgi:hypothetical protein
MAAKKKDTEKVSDEVVEAVQEEAKPAAKLPKSRVRPTKPTGPFVNSSFADRAKASGANKRVASSDSK